MGRTPSFAFMRHLAVSNYIMRMRWRLVLPLVGLFLFSIGSIGSFRFNRQILYGSGKYFWWSSIRLDRDPLNKHPRAMTPCNPATADCLGWDPVSIWVDPGWLAKALMISAFPAFVAGASIVGILGRFGVSQVVTFMIVMPPLICAWYYFVAWMFGYLMKRRRAKQPASP